MNDDAMNAPSPLWVRVLRSIPCFFLAAVLAWRGTAYEDAAYSTAMPFVMCQCTALVLSLIGLMNLDHGGDVGPA